MQLAFRETAVPRTVQEFYRRLPPGAVEAARRMLMADAAISAAERAAIWVAPAGRLLEISVGALGPAAVVQALLLGAEIYMDHRAYQQFLADAPRELKAQQTSINMGATLQAAKGSITAPSAPSTTLDLTGTPLLKGGHWHPDKPRPAPERRQPVSDRPTPTRDAVVRNVVARVAYLDERERTTLAAALIRHLAKQGITDGTGTERFIRQLSSSPQTWVGIVSEARQEGWRGTQGQPKSRNEVIAEAVKQSADIPTHERDQWIQVLKRAMDAAGIRQGNAAVAWLRNLHSSPHLWQALQLQVSGPTATASSSNAAPVAAVAPVNAPLKVPGSEIGMPRDGALPGEAARRDQKRKFERDLQEGLKAWRRYND